MSNIYTGNRYNQNYDLTPEYYVYMYLRENDSEDGPTGSPYYIGKGKGHRAFDSSSHIIKPNKEKTNIRFIEENISEETAFMWEEFWISYFGRIDLGTGCLRNKSNGGDGAAGRVVTDETRKKQSDLMKDIPKSETHKKIMSDQRKGIDPKTLWSQETLNDMENVLIRQAEGIRNAWTEERKKQQSERMSGQNNPRYVDGVTEKRRIEKENEPKKKRIPWNKGKTGVQVAWNKGKNITPTIVKCPYCNEEGGNNVMKQWHFDKCKKKIIGE